VTISGVTGLQAELWNRTFAIYDVTPTTFEFAGGVTFPPPEGFPIATPHILHFDRVLQSVPANMRVNIGPGVYQTRGYAPGRVVGWQPKSAQKIVGAGFDVTTLQLVGAAVIKPNSSTRVEEHYHAIGTPIVPTGSTPLVPLKHFEVSDLTIDCNVDNQSLVEQDAYSMVACGAVRVLGNHCRIRNVKAINFGTKTLKQGCFVLSIIGASAEPTVSNQPFITECVDNRIEDCIAVQPSKNNIRETTVLHLGGVKNAQSHAQAFSRASVIRRNFVDCSYYTSFDVNHSYEPLRVTAPFPSPFITSASGTTIGPVTNEGTFVGQRPHFRNTLDAGQYVRFYHPTNPLSRWNGYFQIKSTPTDERTLVLRLGTTPSGSVEDSSFVVMGAEFRGIGISSGARTIIEQNQIHNCWIGGPYQGLLDDDAEYDPDVPPTLAREERLDALNSLCTQSAIVRDNHYRAVAVGPYFNMGGMTNAVAITNLAYDPATGVATATTAANHHLWINARVLIATSTYSDIHEVTEPSGTTFKVQLPPGLSNGANPTYRVVSGLDFLVIENNQIGLLDLDETAFGIKTYRLAASPSEQKFQACGIIVGDNNLNGLFAHREVYVRNNKINYVDNQVLPTFYGAGLPIGMAMELAGIKFLHVTHNVMELNPAGRIRTFHCGKVHAFNNRKFNGEIVPVTNWESMSWYDEPETILEDAFLLKFLLRRRRG